MIIRKSNITDLNKILQIYSFAREQMKKNGNPTQWGDKSPADDIVLNDIRNENSYVIESNGEINGVFTFIIGVDPTYKIIDGQWKNDEEYGTIHRIASNGEIKGLFEFCLNYCIRQMPNIRIDTHKDNLIMQHLLEKYEFEKCGIITVADGSARIAFQKTLNRKN